MSRFKNYISIFLFATALLGLFSTMAHFHSKGLECLDHAKDQHYTESELICPVSCIVGFSEPENPSSAVILPFTEDDAFDALIPLHTTSPDLVLFGRAPPELV